MPVYNLVRASATVVEKPFAVTTLLLDSAIVDDDYLLSPISYLFSLFLFISLYLFHSRELPM
jgi:hypothetical protein